MKPIIKINKSELSKLNFSKTVEVKAPSKKRRLLNKLCAAANAKKDGDGKVAIIFKSQKRGVFKVNSAVMMVGQKFIQLKGGYYIPLNAILNVKFRTIG